MTYKMQDAYIAGHTMFVKTTSEKTIAVHWFNLMTAACVVQSLGFAPTWLDIVIANFLKVYHTLTPKKSI
jgi:hypothetical protein